MDERPWFQMMKRKRSVTETSNQNNFRNTENMFDYDGDHSTPMIQGRSYPVIENQVGGSGNMGRGQNTGVANQENSMTPKGYPTFRSGLQLLLDAEK